MSRVKRGVTSPARHKKVLARASGYRGRSNSNFRVAIERVEKGLQYAYRDRRKKKSTWRQLWIIRINAACRSYDISYSRFVHGLKVAGIELDRKSLSEIAIHDETAFKVLVEKSIEANKAA